MLLSRISVSLSHWCLSQKKSQWKCPQVIKKIITLYLSWKQELLFGTKIIDKVLTSFYRTLNKKGAIYKYYCLTLYSSPEMFTQQTIHGLETCQLAWSHGNTEKNTGTRWWTFTFYWNQEEKQRQKSGMEVKLKKKRITKCVGRLEQIKIYFYALSSLCCSLLSRTWKWYNESRGRIDVFNEKRNTKSAIYLHVSLFSTLTHWAKIIGVKEF